MATTSALMSIAMTAAGAAGAFSPKVPKPKPPPLMQSQAQLTQAQQLEAARSAAMRRGRASTLLTTNADTGDRLGP